MRFALVQIEVQRTGRSANLTRVLRMVRKAAESDPAPDVVLLPAACDGFSSKGVTQAMAEGFSESLAAAAREWGVYVASGGLQPSSAGPVEQARLYDPDGDVIASNPRSTNRGAAEALETSLGRLSIGLGSGDGLYESLRDGCEADLVLIHGRWSASEDPAAECRRLHEVWTKLAVRLGATVCAVGPVGESPFYRPGRLVGPSAVVASNGRLLAAARTETEEIVCAEVAIEAEGPVPTMPSAEE